MESVRIPLSQGQFALVDSADAERVGQWKWSATKGRRGTFYARRGDGSGGQIRLHRFILGLPPGRIPEVDHINHDGLDNRRANLRIARSFDNVGNSRRRTTNHSGYKGVWFNRGGYWYAKIATRNLGMFDSPEEAARAYDTAARERYGEFADLNFPDDMSRVPPRVGVLSRTNTSGYRGVSYRRPRDGRRGCWVARFSHLGHRSQLGYFATKEAAARAWDAKAIEVLGPTAWVNFPIGD